MFENITSVRFFLRHSVGALYHSTNDYSPYQTLTLTLTLTLTASLISYLPCLTLTLNLALAQCGLS